MDHCQGRDTTCHWQDSSLLQANPLLDFGRERVLKFKFKTRTMNSGSVSTAIFPVWIGEHSITWIRFRNASAGKHITENCWNPGRLYKLAKSESRGPGPVLVSSEQSLCTVTGNTTRILCKTQSCLNFSQARSWSLEWLLAAAHDSDLPQYAPASWAGPARRQTETWNWLGLEWASAATRMGDQKLICLQEMMSWPCQCSPGPQAQAPARLWTEIQVLWRWPSLQYCHFSWFATVLSPSIATRFPATLDWACLTQAQIGLQALTVWPSGIFGGAI